MNKTTKKLFIYTPTDDVSLQKLRERWWKLGANKLKLMDKIIEITSGEGITFSIELNSHEDVRLYDKLVDGLNHPGFLAKTYKTKEL